DADEITVGQAHFDSEAIKEINARSAKETSKTTTLIDEFFIVGSRLPKEREIARFDLTDGKNKFNAILDMSNDGPFSQDELMYFYNSGYPSKPIRLTIDIKTINNEIKQAYITEIHLPDQTD